jgi:hypothetical protein
MIKHSVTHFETFHEHNDRIALVPAVVTDEIIFIFSVVREASDRCRWWKKELGGAGGHILTFEKKVGREVAG